MEILSIPLMILGLLIFFFWGLAVLFLPFAEIVFLFVHWQDAKNSFKIIMFGLLLMLAGQFLGPARSVLIEHVRNF